MANEFMDDVSTDKAPATFGLLLLHATTNVHLLHWQSQSYSQHVTLGELYAALEEGVDEFIEKYMGKYGRIENFPHFYDLPDNDPVKEVEQIYDQVKMLREKLPQDSDMQQLVDNIVNDIAESLYKLRFLK